MQYDFTRSRSVFAGIITPKVLGRKHTEVAQTTLQIKLKFQPGKDIPELPEQEKRSLREIQMWYLHPSSTPSLAIKP
jgi:hypothetical protein